MNLMEMYLNANNFDKELSLLVLVLEYIKEKNIKMKYSQDFLKDLEKFSKQFLILKARGINLTNLLIDTTSKNFKYEAESIFQIKKMILNRFNEEDLNFLRLNHNKLFYSCKDEKALLAYKNSTFFDAKSLKDKINYIILKRESEECKDIKETFNILGLEYKSLILKSQDNKPVYIGLKHLFQKKLFLEGPFFKDIVCPKCGNKIIHLLEGNGSIYTCKNTECKFYISGNFFLKKGKEDLNNFFSIKECVDRKSSHLRIFKTLESIKNREKYIELEVDNFKFKYEYIINEYSVGMRLVEIEYGIETLNLRDFYAQEKIRLFLKNFFQNLDEF